MLLSISQLKFWSFFFLMMSFNHAKLKQNSYTFNQMQQY